MFLTIYTNSSPDPLKSPKDLNFAIRINQNFQSLNFVILIHAEGIYYLASS